MISGAHSSSSATRAAKGPDLPKTWAPLRPHLKQYQAYFSKQKFVGLACGRGSGKSELAKRRIIRALPVTKPWPDPIYFYALPTYNQAKRVAWESLIKLIPPSWIKRDGLKVSELYIDTVFGSRLYVVGMDKPERIEGVQWDGGVLDEACDHKPGSFDKSVLPALTHRCEFFWRIGVPKRQGPSAIEFKEWFNKVAVGDIPNALALSWPSKDILPPEAINWAKNHLDPSDYDEQFEANFGNASGAVYKEFTRANVSQHARYIPSLPIHVACDFNIDPMSWVLCHYIKELNVLLVFDELRSRDTTTTRQLAALHEKYKDHKGGWSFAGDASAHHRHSNSDITDYLLINNSQLFGNKGINFNRSNPSLKTRFSCVNAALCNANGIRRILINPECRWLIRDLQNVTYKPGTNEQDGSDRTLTHMSDALGYLVVELFPIPFLSAEYAASEITIATDAPTFLTT